MTRNALIVIIVLVCLFGGFDRGQRMPYGILGTLLSVLAVIVVIDLIFKIL